MKIDRLLFLTTLALVSFLCLPTWANDLAWRVDGDQEVSLRYGMELEEQPSEESKHVILEPFRSVSASTLVDGQPATQFQNPGDFVWYYVLRLPNVAGSTTVDINDRFPTRGGEWRARGW